MAHNKVTRKRHGFTGGSGWQVGGDEGRGCDGGGVIFFGFCFDHNRYNNY